MKNARAQYRSVIERWNSGDLPRRRVLPARRVDRRRRQLINRARTGWDKAREALTGICKISVKAPSRISPSEAASTVCSWLGSLLEGAGSYADGGSYSFRLGTLCRATSLKEGGFLSAKKSPAARFSRGRDFLY